MMPLIWLCCQIVIYACVWKQPQAAAKASKKAKKQKQNTAEATHESEPLTMQLNRDASLFSQDKQPEAKPVRFDEEGLPVYKEADLKINQGGWTEHCPFDCDCCFRSEEHTSELQSLI